MLNNYVALYVPTCRQNNSRIAQESLAPWIEVVTKTMVTLFGGCTIAESQGHHVNPDDTVCVEEVLVIHSYCDDNHLREGRVEMYDLARKLCFSLAQSCIAMVIDGGMHFIPA